MELDTIIQGDALETLRTLSSESVNCIVTSPPYYGLRDYGTSHVDGGDPDCAHEWEEATRTPWANAQPGPNGRAMNPEASHWRPKTVGGYCLNCGGVRVDEQIGLEATPEDYVAQLVDVFREARRVLRADGTLWLNLGDSYANDAKWGGSTGGKHAQGLHGVTGTARAHRRTAGLKPKDLIGIPWRVAFALQADGWWLRSDIIWAKGNPMPESVLDRPTRSHEYIFLLSKSAQYFYDADAIREQVRPKTPTTYGCATAPSKGNDALGGVKADNWARSVAKHQPRTPKSDKQRGHSRRHAGFNDRWDAMSRDEQQAMGANKRDVWTVGTHAFPEAHFATFPPALIEPCILAGCPAGGIVLDPFMGAGTVGVVARRHSRHWLGIELNLAYVAMAEARIAREVQPVLWSIASGQEVAI